MTTRLSFGRWLRLALYTPLLVLPQRGAAARIRADVLRWEAMPGVTLRLPDRWWLVELLASYAEFRTLFYYRLRRSGDTVTRALGVVANIVYPGERTLFLSCPEIGPGLFVQHGFATIIVAESLGAGCWINQQVTVGFRDQSDLSAPRIGDRVHIGAGAKVLGGIVIGDDARIGANAVVLSDVPAGYTAVGVPARMFPSRS